MTVYATDKQFSTLVVFVFNVGVQEFSKLTTLKILNEGKYKVKSQTFKGLGTRREQEVKLWQA